MNKIIEKLKCATRCHPNAAQTLIEEAIVMLEEELKQESPSRFPQPVAHVCNDFTLCWVGIGPIKHIIDKYGIKVGDKLYVKPPEQQIPGHDEYILKLLKEREILSEALQRYADPANWCYDTCNLSRETAQSAITKCEDQKLKQLPGE